MSITNLLAVNDNNSPNIGIAYTTVIEAGGTTRDYQLDIYHLNERSRGSRPVVIGIHGGGWFGGNKDIDSFTKNKANFFVQQKFVYVAINYRLSPAGNIGTSIDNWNSLRVRYPAHYNDMATAIRWVRDNISQYGGDPNKLVLIGHSAGAQSVALLGTNHQFINGVGVPTSSIKGVISVDTEGYNVLDVIVNPVGEYSIGNGSPDGQRKIYENAFGVYPGLHTGTTYQTLDYLTVTGATNVYNKASPDKNLTTPNIPTLMIIGRGDSDRVATQRKFYSNMIRVGVAGTYISYPNAVNGITSTYTHEEISDCIGASQDPPLGRALPVGIGNVSTEITKFISSLNL